MIGKALSSLAAASLVAGAVALVPAAQAKPQKGDKMVCRTTDKVGSRLGKNRSCKTAAEWAEIDRQMKATVEHIQASRNWNSELCPNPGSC